MARGIRRKLIVAVIAAADAANCPLLRFGNLNVHYQRALFAVFVAHIVIQLPSKILQNRRAAAGFGLMAGGVFCSVCWVVSSPRPPSAAWIALSGGG